MKKRYAALLIAALLLGLTACAPGEPDAAPDVPSSTPTAAVTPTAGPTPEPAPEPTPDPMAWDEGHTLDTGRMPGNYGGLELPVRGATGYASVELPLWEVQPAPEPTPTPAPTEEPVPEPTPLPVETAEPAEGETSEPAPTPVPAEELPIPTESGGEEPPIVEPTAPLPTPTPDPYEGALAVLAPGEPFTILDEEDEWWQVRSKQGTGWVEHRYCLINLPDVVPSIVYDATNSYDSRYRSGGKPIPNVTGEAFYPAKTYNERLKREEFMMPVLYAMAPKLARAQRAALEQGNSLILYEGYRPYSVQKTVLRELSALAKADPEVKAGISTPPWAVWWFISDGYSNHQRGYAADMGLAKVWKTGTDVIGGYDCLRVREYGTYAMPTPIHELSSAAAAFAEPAAIHSSTAWKRAQPAEGMNAPAFGLQRYCTDAGLTPLASEWWHFNDLDARAQVRENESTGGFRIKTTVSTAP